VNSSDAENLTEIFQTQMSGQLRISASTRCGWFQYTMPSPNGVKLHQPRQFTRPSPVTVALNAENSTKSIRISSWSLRFTTIPKKSNHVNQSSAAVPRQLIWSQTNLSADLQHCLCYTMAPHPCYCDLHIGIVARCL
jgi:hypothetical protein